MVQKIEKLLDVATEAFAAMRAYYEKEGGVVLSLKPQEPAIPLDVLKPAKEKKAKEKKAKEPAPAAEAFPVGGPAKAPDAAEAKRRCLEVMSLFIRRYLKATPPGLDRAKAIMAEVCGREIVKLEELTAEDHLKLIPRFEKELEAADAK